MAKEYSEKRDFFRMNMACDAQYTINGSGTFNSALVSNLSGNGISIIADRAVELGTEMRIRVTPANAVTPPLDIVMEVLRCEQQDQTRYLLAGNITER